MSAARVLPHPAALRRAYESAGTPAALPNWVTAARPPDADIYAGLRALRARSREAAQSDDHMVYFLGLVEANVIGSTGIQVDPRPKRAGGTLDRRTAKALETAWARQCKRGTWDATGQLSRLAFETLGVRTAAQDGEVLIRIHEDDRESPTGFSVELIDAEALDVDYNVPLPNGNVIRMGVEMTPRRRPVAYHLFSEPAHLWGYAATYSAAQRVRVPASDIIHVYLPHWVWGSRGVPWARTALRRLRMLGGYEEAAITAARVAAAKSAAYVAQPDAPPPSTGPGGEPQPDGSFAQAVEPGGIEQVPYGWDLKALDWGWPNTQHGEFCKAALRGIACGLGVSYNALANDLEGVNYSSLRSGALHERDLWMRLQAWWIEWVTVPLYQRWAAHAIRYGLVSMANGQPLPIDRMDLLTEATFQGRRWPWVDPLKDGQANQLAIKSRTRSISSIIRESGGEPEEVWTELAEDLETLARLGIPLALDTAPAAAPAGAKSAETHSPPAAGTPAAPAEEHEEAPTDA